MKDNLYAFFVGRQIKGNALMTLFFGGRESFVSAYAEYRKLGLTGMRYYRTSSEFINLLDRS